METKPRRLSPYGKTFFGLTVDDKKYLLEELFQLVFHGKFSLSDARLLPVYQRKWFIDRTVNEIENIKKAVEAAAKAGKKK